MPKKAGTDPSNRSDILIVDDDPGILDLLKRTMEMTGHNCIGVNDGESALAIIAQKPFDLVVTDINMPGMTGIELAKKILKNFSADIIVMTGQTKGYQYDEVINLGASDFVEKPFSIQEIILRIQRVLRERRLKEETRKSHEELKQAYLDSIHRLVMASELKDEGTGDHIIRIGKYSSLISKKLHQSDLFIEAIGYASPMHDVGKIGIPDRILLKPGKLTKEEFDIMKTHSLIGAKLLSQSKSRILQMASEIAMNHHEKFNGNGYPNGISGKDIPISGRIVAIADTFDALTSHRPYKDAYPREIVYDIIKKEKGEHFDPEITELFLENFDEFMEIRQGSKNPAQENSKKNFRLSERDQNHIQT